MFATLYRMQARPGLEDAVLDHFAEWRSGRGYVVPCAGGFLYRPRVKCDGWLIGTAVFTDKGAPSQDADLHAWHGGLRRLLVAEPECDDDVRFLEPAPIRVRPRRRSTEEVDMDQGC